MQPDTVEFEVSLPDVVTRVGKVFEVGDYADKQFSLTEEEADVAVAAFQPVPGNLEHRPHILNGKVGTLKRLWREGKDLLGEVDVPAWFDAVLTDSERKVSAEWNRATKTLTGWCWTVQPRVSDAALMSAYAEFAATQQTETTTAPADPPTPITDKEKHMSLKEKWDAFFAENVAKFERDPGDETTTTTTTTTTPEPPREPVPVPPTDNAAFSALQAQVAELKREKVEAEAKAFADEQVREGRMFPAERAAFIAAFALAAHDDENHAHTVTFSAADGSQQTATRVETLKVLFANRPSHGLTEEAVKADIQNGQNVVLMSKETTAGKDGPLSDEEKARLLALSPIGRGLADQFKNGK